MPQEQYDVSGTLDLGVQTKTGSVALAISGSSTLPSPLPFLSLPSSCSLPPVLQIHPIHVTLGSPDPIFFQSGFGSYDPDICILFQVRINRFLIRIQDPESWSLD